ncbi:MAG: hypothetical protein ACREEQ_03130, partial [Caulobacteraceae bacterium]
MAMKTHWKRPLVGFAVLLAIAAMPAVALAGGNWGGGGGTNCGCKPPQHHRPPTNVNVNNNNVNVNVNVQSNAVAVARASAVATARSNAASFANNMAFGSGAAVGGGSGMAAGYAGPGAVSVVNLGSGGGGEEAYQATRSRFEKVVVQAFCFDDKDVPHPASQVTPDRDISNAYEGEVYR